MRHKSIKIAESLMDYDCQVKILNIDGFEDVGAMTKREFLQRREDAKIWTQKQSLMEKISSLRSGSLF